MKGHEDLVITTKCYNPVTEDINARQFAAACHAVEPA
jgi:hypothetical protein